MERNSYDLLIKLCVVGSTGKKVPKELSTRQKDTLEDDLQSRQTNFSKDKNAMILSLINS